MAGDPHDTDPTLTPSQAIGTAATSASVTPGRSAQVAGALPERYTPGRRIGAGGMGEVILARDEQIGRDVAIKRMRVEPTEAATARFLREARIQGRLDHPAIVPVHELANDGEGRPFFVMKRLTGTTLTDILAGGKTTRQKLLRAFADVCLAVEFAHEHGVVHRDLKPDNIMLGDFGEVYVLDWGIARVEGVDDPVSRDTVSGRDSLATEVGSILGTPGYISPEQIRGETIDERADVYALGSILFEILAGTSLLPRGLAALDAANSDVEARPSVRAPGCECPPELDAICVAATSRERTARPKARALAEQIERFLDGDRDVALRKSLADKHLEAARESLAAGDGETTRATAMREAGRAIALDPRSAEAAQLVGRLMLEPPRHVPREVEARVTEVEEQTAHQKVKLVANLMLSLLLVVPTAAVLGVRDMQSLYLYIAVVVGNIALTFYAARRTRPPSPMSVTASAVAFGIFIAVIAHEFSPFLLAPAIAVFTAIIFMVDPRLPWRLLTAYFALCVVGPWLLEFTGLVPRTTATLHGDLMLHSTFAYFTHPGAEIGLAVFITIALVSAGVTARQLGVAQRTAIRSIELQAWHLRQLVGG